MRKISLYKSWILSLVIIIVGCLIFAWDLNTISISEETKRVESILESNDFKVFNYVVFGKNRIDMTHPVLDWHDGHQAYEQYKLFKEQTPNRITSRYTSSLAYYLWLSGHTEDTKNLIFDELNRFDDNDLYKDNLKLLQASILCIEGDYDGMLKALQTIYHHKEYAHIINWIEQHSFQRGSIINVFKDDDQEYDVTLSINAYYNNLKDFTSSTVGNSNGGETVVFTILEEPLQGVLLVKQMEKKHTTSVEIIDVSDKQGIIKLPSIACDYWVSWQQIHDKRLIHSTDRSITQYAFEKGISCRIKIENGHIVYEIEGIKNGPTSLKLCSSIGTNVYRWKIQEVKGTVSFPMDDEFGLKDKKKIKLLKYRFFIEDLNFQNGFFSTALSDKLQPLQ